ncbi:MAG: EAL domain-containing protein, partial [Pseudomonadota bacterium]
MLQTPNFARRRSSPLQEALDARDRETIQMVKDAIKTQNVLLAFQPIVSAAHPERPAFYEGLMRVLDQTGRVIPAADFIDAIETTEIGREIDRLALKFGLDTLAQVPGLRLSVNMSARSINNKAWMQTLERGLNAAPTVGERLILEITESSTMDM